jgi:hypothetical protein
LRVKKSLTHGIHRFSVAYFAQTFCENASLWLFLAVPATNEILGETSSEGIGSREKPFTQMSLLQGIYG